MESWFSTMTFELGDRFETHPSAKAELFDYIEVFYNQERRHSTLGYLSPAQFGRQHGWSTQQRNQPVHRIGASSAAG